MKKQHEKVFRLFENAVKEAAVLTFLSFSEIHNLVPIMLDLRQTDDQTEIIMSFMSGKVLCESDLNQNFMYTLGSIAKKIHNIDNYCAFDFLNGQLSIRQSRKRFSEFIHTKIVKWRDQYNFGQDEMYIISYTDWLLAGYTALKDRLNQCRPVFCHGDFDLQNIIVQSGVITGLVDWEHSGVFCLEWELRKLSRLCNVKNNLLKAFLTGYGDSPDAYANRVVIVKYLEACDLLGHLGWCLQNSLMEEYNKTILKMNVFYIPRKS